MAAEERLWRQFLRGAAYPWQALHFLSAHRLWGLALWAVWLHALLLFALLGVAFVWALPALAHALQATDAAHAAGVWPWLRLHVLVVLVWGIGVPLTGLLSLLLTLVLGQAVASPILERLTARIEALRLGPAAPQPPQLAWTGQAVAAAAELWASTALLLQGMLPRLLWLVVPGVGVAVAFLWGAWFVALDFCSLPLARHGMRLPERRRLLTAVWPYVWGFGVSTHLMLWLPGLNIVLLPVAATGASLLLCDLHRTQRLRLHAEQPQQNALGLRRDTSLRQDG